MTIFDRYLLRTFCKVLLVSFLSLTGLYVVIDTFNNLEEFLSYANQQGSLLGVLADYYGARVLSFFDRISGLLALLATIFTVTWLPLRVMPASLAFQIACGWRFSALG